MKKGVFTSILSFVLGMVWLIYSILNHNGFGAVYVTKSFSFMSHTVTLPGITLPSFYVMGILALFVNLCALITAASSISMGAAVLYAVAIGFEPDCYPYAGVLFLLSLFAAARMRKNEYIDDDPADKTSASGRVKADQQSSYVRHTVDGSGTEKNIQGSRAYNSKNNAAAREMEAQKRAAEKAMRVSGSSSADVLSSSYEALRAQEEREAFRTRNGSKAVAITFVVILICAMAIVIPILMQTKRINARRSTTRETAFTTTGNSVYDQYLRDKGYLTDSGSAGSSGRSDGRSGSDVTSGDLSGSDSVNGRNGGAAGTATSQSIDLTGEWISDSGQSSRSGMAASISEEEINVYWINSDGSRAQYWSGSYQPMEHYQDPYTWISVRKMTVSPGSTFASQEQTMGFTYSDSDGILSFNAKVMGLPMTYKLHRNQSGN